jgi:putative transferase (TIGR04331 family)
LVNSDISKKIFIKNQNINIYKNFEYSIRKKNDKIKFINENERFLKIEKNFNLFIHIFFGTPFFECMTLNKPSIIIYQKNIHPPFDKKFTSYIKRLEEEKILYYTEKKAANFLNKNYNNLEKWWNNKNLQNLRNMFCKDYCLYTNKEIEILKKNLKNI